MKKLFVVFFSLLMIFNTAPVTAEDDEQTIFTEAELAQMLAPIALYPDSVLTHILIASTYPLEIIQANRWVKKNPDLEPAEALNRLEDKDWDPSVKALVPFPNILERLSDDLDWAQRLGDAFLQDESRVLDSIQDLRRKADKAGNLEKMEHMQVTREDNNIVIQPVTREVVYVPYYDPRVAYGSWYWYDYPPVYWDHHYAYHGMYYWHPRVRVSNHFYFSAFNWHNHHVIVLDRHHYRSGHYYHRDHILRHESARRWDHNPSHRRGVAYRSEPVRQRYHSNRVSTIETRTTRHNERAVINNRNQTTRDNSRANNANRQNQTTTRQERLRDRLDSNNDRKDVVRNNRDIKQPRNNAADNRVQANPTAKRDIKVDTNNSRAERNTPRVNQTQPAEVRPRQERTDQSNSNQPRVNRERRDDRQQQRETEKKEVTPPQQTRVNNVQQSNRQVQSRQSNNEQSRAARNNSRVRDNNRQTNSRASASKQRRESSKQRNSSARSKDR